MSTQTNQTNTKKNYIHKNCFSSGNLFLDKIIGGYSVGSTVLIKEDNYSYLYFALLKYFLGEGMVKNHQNFILYSNKIQAENLVESIPYKSTQVESLLNAKKINDCKENEMKIAWRYENIKYSNLVEDIAKSSEYIFDISRPIQENLKKKVISVNIEEDSQELPLISKLKKINQSLVAQLQEYLISQSNNDEENIAHVRVVIPSLFNEEDTQYLEEYEKSSNIAKIKSQLMALKNIARSINGVILLTINPSISLELENLFNYFIDYVLNIKGFTLEDDNLEDYNGLLTICKIPRINALKMIMHNIDTDIYGLILEKRKLVIEQVDIGIEIDRNTKVKEKDVKGHGNTDNQPVKIDY